MSKSAEKALSLLRHMPRLTLRAAERMPDIRKKVIQFARIKLIKQAGRPHEMVHIWTKQKLTFYSKRPYVRFRPFDTGNCIV